MVGFIIFKQGVFMDINVCAYCGFQTESLTVVEYLGLDFYLCDSCLLEYLNSLKVTSPLI